MRGAALIMLAWNQWPLTRRCLDSLLASAPFAAEVIVVDNGSSDETPAGLVAYADRVRIVALPEKKGGWADPATPTKLDETAGNWMTKLDRLHVQEYVETPKTPLRREDAVLVIEYFDGSKPLGFLELYKTPAEKGSDYFVKTERTRWAAQVLTSAAEQVDQDLGSVLK